MKFNVPTIARALALCLAASSTAITAQASDFASTWSGTISDGQQQVPFEVSFSAAGNPLVQYATRDYGVRTVELSQVGQQVRYIPPGGGVASLTVADLGRESGRLRVSYRSSFEQGHGSLMDQSDATVTQIFTLQGETLHLQMSAGGRDATTGADGGFSARSQQNSEQRASGVLSRVR